MTWIVWQSQRIYSPESRQIVIVIGEKEHKILLPEQLCP